MSYSWWHEGRSAKHSVSFFSPSCIGKSVATSKQASIQAPLMNYASTVHVCSISRSLATNNFSNLFVSRESSCTFVIISFLLDRCSTWIWGDSLQSHAGFQPLSDVAVNIVAAQDSHLLTMGPLGNKNRVTFPIIKRRDHQARASIELNITLPVVRRTN